MLTHGLDRCHAQMEPEAALVSVGLAESQFLLPRLPWLDDQLIVTKSNRRSRTSNCQNQADERKGEISEE
jgi:hypothetical protein